MFFENYNIIDLTHIVDENIPLWPDSQRLQRHTHKDYEPNCCRVESYTMAAGTGTHIDAPSHFVKNGRNISDLTIHELIVPACVIDVRQQVASNPDYQIDLADIEIWEKQNGTIPKNSLVLACTGWSARWPDQKSYQNFSDDGMMHFPGFSKEAAELLVIRDVVGIGIDTLSLDAGINTKFSVHHIMLGAGKYQIENLTNLEKLPTTGAIVFALPIKIKNATESSARVVTLIPK